MDMLTLRSISAEREGMRDAERQTKVMLSVRVHGAEFRRIECRASGEGKYGIVEQSMPSTTISNVNDNVHSE